MNDIIHTASLALCVAPKQIFLMASEEMRFTNADDVAKNRFERWIKYGEIPPYVESHCKRQLDNMTNAVRLYESREASRVTKNGDEYPLFI